MNAALVDTVPHWAVPSLDVRHSATRPLRIWESDDGTLLCVITETHVGLGVSAVAEEVRRLLHWQHPWRLVRVFEQHPADEGWRFAEITHDPTTGRTTWAAIDPDSMTGLCGPEVQHAPTADCRMG